MTLFFTSLGWTGIPWGEGGGRGKVILLVASCLDKRDKLRVAREPTLTFFFKC